MARDPRQRPRARTARQGRCCGPAWPARTGLPLPLREVTPRDLGVHPSRFGAEGNSPYIRRQADDLLAAPLPTTAKRLVIVEGPRLAGATSTLAQAAQVLPA